MKTNKLLIIIFLLGFQKILAKDIEGLPSDLNKEKIIFLEYEPIPIEDEMPGLVKSTFRRYNELFIDANKQFREKVKEYPFSYVISRRAEYRDSLAKVCKYVLENDLMENANNGVNQYAGRHVIYESYMYIKDLKTGDKYLLFKIDTNHILDYKGILKQFYKMIEKNYVKKKK